MTPQKTTAKKVIVNGSVIIFEALSIKSLILVIPRIIISPLFL
jgi:hypothetical protein